VEAAEAFADGLIGRDALDAAKLAGPGSSAPFRDWGDLALRQASTAMLDTTAERAASAAYQAGRRALAALGRAGRAQNRRRLCDLLREVFGNPFRPLRPRHFPAHLLELAQECYDAFPAVSDGFPVLADALADLGEEQATEHCRQGGHVKGCHVLDWVLGRR
jgi:hypothetical protein